MIAFIDSPIQLLVAAVIILIVFGPQKLPEIFGQLGKGIRELKKAGQEFSSAINTEDYSGYGGTRYDAYNTSYDSSSYAQAEREAEAIEAAPAPAEQPIGDHAASALADPADAGHTF